MPGVLDRLAQQATRDENQNLARAANDAQWANTFNSVQSDDKLRANLNLDEMIARTAANKIRRIQETDPALGIQYARQQEVLDRTLHANEMAPLNVKVRQAQFEATGAAERRKALEAKTEAEHTAALNNGMLKIYQQGLVRGTPEFQSAAVDLLSRYPAAHLEHVSELGKMAGFSADLSPEQYVSEAVKLKKLATEQGMTNPSVRSYSGRPVVVEGAEVVSAEQKIADAVARKKALMEIQPPPKAPAKKVDSYKKFNEELEAAVTAHGGQDKVPAEVWKSFEQRKKALISGKDESVVPAGVAPKLAAATDGILKSARAAIAAGKDAEAVKKRLQESGFDPSGL